MMTSADTTAHSLNSTFAFIVSSLYAHTDADDTKEEKSIENVSHSETQKFEYGPPFPGDDGQLLAASKSY